MSSLTPIQQAVWSELTQGRSVIVRFTNAKNVDDVFAQSRSLVDALRPCGIKQETDCDIQFVNGAWMHLRKHVPLPTQLLTSTTVTIIEHD